MAEAGFTIALGLLVVAYCVSRLIADGRASQTQIRRLDNAFRWVLVVLVVAYLATRIHFRG